MLDGVCCVVGSCAGGFDSETNIKGDIIYTNTEIQDKGKEGMQQYFWEAFIQEFGIESFEVDDTVRSTVANDLQWLNAYKNALQAAHEESSKVESCCNRHCNEPTVAFVFNAFDLAHNHTVASISHLLDPSGARIPYEMLKKY